LLMILGCAWLPLVGGVGAAPAAPTHAAIEQTINTIKKGWAKPGERPPTADGWEAFFAAIEAELNKYAQAQSLEDRASSLERLGEIETVLATTTWQPGLDLLAELRRWSEPRRRVVAAERGLDTAVRALPPTTDQSAQAMRTRWLTFTHDELGKAFRDYESATTVATRQAALDRVQQALAALDLCRKGHPWNPSSELSAAFGTLFNHPNFDLVVDAATLAPLFEVDLVQSGPVTRKGYVSQVTAGPKTGYGLLESEDGIRFFNSQLYTSETPIWDFQNQIASDRRGRRAAKLYTFYATSLDNAELFITTTIRPAGLEIVPSYRHAISGSVCSQPNEQGGLGRALAAVLGMNQRRITAKVQKGAVANFQARIPAEAMEEGLERTAAEAERRNAELHSRYGLHDDELVVRDVKVSALRLRSNPAAAFVAGIVGPKSQAVVRGADAPPPPPPGADTKGIVARIHLGSLLTSMAAGLGDRPEVQAFNNAMVLIRTPGPGVTLRDAVKLERNVDFATFARTVDEARATGGKLVALRVKKPSMAPEFRTDARGYLVALIHDVTIDVPAPPSEARGGLMGAPAKIYRLSMPHPEVAFSFTLKPTADGMLELEARAEDFNPGPDAKVLAINDSEIKATALSRFSGGIVLGVLGGQLRSRPIHLKLDPSKLPGKIKVKSISPLDPGGWISINIERQP